MVTLFPDTMASITIQLEALRSLRDVQIKGGELAMRPLNEDHLTSLIMSDAHDWSPILVTCTDQGYVLLDGYHRQEAARQKGLSVLTATVQTFSSENDLVEAAFRANLTHGLRASLRTRSDYAY